MTDKIICPVCLGIPMLITSYKKHTGRPIHLKNLYNKENNIIIEEENEPIDEESISEEKVEIDTNGYDVKKNQRFCFICKKPYNKSTFTEHENSGIHQTAIIEGPTENRFIKTHPYLICEWDNEKNGEFDINTITYGSQKKINWVCKKDNHIHEWIARLDHRTGKNNSLYSCLKCKNNSNDKEDMLT